MVTIGSIFGDPITVWVCLTNSAEAWRRDATLYQGVRCERRLAKARELEDRAREIELMNTIGSI